MSQIAGAVHAYAKKIKRWVNRHSVVLIDDWYADTNLHVERMRTLLPAAVRAAGLPCGGDVRVFWRKTVLG